MLIWKFNNINDRVASVRYRGLKPISLLRDAGQDCVPIWGRQRVPWTANDSLINVKSYTFHDLMLVQTAHAEGLKVFLDLCDNLFVESYKSAKTIDPIHMFTAMSRYAAAVVTTTPALAQQIRAHLPDVRVEIIPDGIETEGDARRFDEILSEKKLTQPAVNHLKHQLKAQGRRAFIRYAPKKISAELARTVRDRWSAFRSERQTRALLRRERSRGPDRPRRILWFGNHGASHAKFGIADLRLIRPAFERLAQEQPVELWVISNHKGKYEKFVATMELPSRYIEWDPSSIYDWIRMADVVVIPNNKDPFSLCKSANRAVLALSLGTPVIATYTPAFEPLRDCVAFDDWYENLKIYLSDPSRVDRDLRSAKSCLDATYSDSALRDRWLQVIQDSRRPDTDGSPKIGFLVQLVQDLEILLPLIRRTLTDHSPIVFIELKTAEKFPHVWEQISVPFKRLVSLDSLDTERDYVEQLDAFVTASESNLRPHKLARRMTEIAKSAGVRTFTIQHGFENIGLTYGDDEHPIDKVNFASDVILTWSDTSQLHPDVPAATKSRCVPIGCPKDVRAEAAELSLPAADYWIGVFENLHWSRYSQSDRDSFLDCLVRTAERLPNVGFLVRPHQAGRWLTERSGMSLPALPNLIVLPPGVPEYQSITAKNLFPLLRGVITTPSTVAVDAVLSDLAVAIAAFDIDLPAYEPLPLLRTRQDWIDFAASLSGGEDGLAMKDRTEAFRSGHLFPGDPAQAFLNQLESTSSNNRSHAT